MNRRQYLPGNLEGPDVDIETSLKEYGLAWNDTDNRNEILFYYGINHDTENYFLFDFCSIPFDTNIKTEYDWADFDAVSTTIGQDIFQLTLTSQIEALISYYGYENVFGSSYWEGLTYQQIMMNW